MLSCAKYRRIPLLKDRQRPACLALACRSPAVLVLRQSSRIKRRPMRADGRTSDRLMFSYRNFTGASDVWQRSKETTSIVDK